MSALGRSVGKVFLQQIARYSISSSARASSVATSKPSALGRAAHSVASPVSELLPKIAIVREPSQRLVVSRRHDPGQQPPENRVRKRGAKTRIEVERIEIVPHPEFRFVAETRASKPLVTVGDRPVHHVANGVVVKMEVEGDSIVQADILPEKSVVLDHTEAEGDHLPAPTPDKEEGLVLHIAAEPAEIVGCQFLETEFRTVEDL